MKWLGIAAFILILALVLVRGYTRHLATVRDAQISTYRESIGKPTPINDVIETHYRYLSEDIQGYCVNLALFAAGLYLIVTSGVERQRQAQTAEIIFQHKLLIELLAPLKKKKEQQGSGEPSAHS